MKSLFFLAIAFASMSNVYGADPVCDSSNINRNLIKAVFRQGIGATAYQLGVINFQTTVSLVRFDISYGQNVGFYATTQYGPQFTRRVFTDTWEVAVLGKLAERVEKIVLCNSMGNLVEGQSNYRYSSTAISVGRYNQRDVEASYVAETVLPNDTYTMIVQFIDGSKSKLKFNVIDQDSQFTE